MIWTLGAVALLATMTAELPAFAEEKTRAIDMTVVLTDEMGKPAKDGFNADPDDKKCEKCPVLTLGAAVAHALNSLFKDEPDEQKWAKGALADRIRNDPNAQLSAEELVVIKRVFLKGWSPHHVAQAFPLLDPNDRPPQIK